ncbi:O-methyltransferase [Antrihabitans cavernicola]|uniref:O-methyltransferase n=1 Tax=Antrihabitans cavernicola TaxID=2495913 RepID=A0A5A7S8E4_9NOCA|nr:O-methyltransferase [Spelaeibacter cavernicola]KAA0021422.1 O-methyltransferase [Spelaeibacter cavernicola]
MTTPDWSDVDRFIVETVLENDETLNSALQDNATAGLPAIDVSPAQGKFLHLLARSVRAREVLEIGTLGGYSTIWLARAVGPKGSVCTLEYKPEHATVARANLDRAGIGDRVTIEVGAALDTLPKVAERGDIFDLVFIDADKENNSNYVQWALRLTRPGSVIVVDNVVRAGGVADANATESRVVASRELLQMLGNEPRLDSTVLQTVGSKGWDGFVFALVQE